MDASDEAALSERANELYWNSDGSVSSIADVLDVSKGALYGFVDPLPAGLPCPRCSAEMEYPNRTAREHGLLLCPGCELEEEEDLVREEWREAARLSDEPALVVSPGSGETARRRIAALHEQVTRKRLLASAALLGAAAGLALALWARRK